MDPNKCATILKNGSYKQVLLCYLTVVGINCCLGGEAVEDGKGKKQSLV